MHLFLRLPFLEVKWTSKINTIKKVFNMHSIGEYLSKSIINASFLQYRFSKKFPNGSALDPADPQD